jgi:N-acetylmuramate 1-kinase
MRRLDSSDRGGNSTALSEPRAITIAHFLRQAGWPSAEWSPLAGDASPRRYHRVTLGRRRAVLMDALPAADADPEPFLAVTEWLRGAGFSAPEVYAADTRSGLILLEDLGDALFARVLNTAPELEEELYAAAVDLLAEMHRQPLPQPSGGWTPAPYDGATYLREARLFVEWYVPAATGTPFDPGLAAEFDALIRDLARPLHRIAPVAVLRDYHSENLIWLPERQGHRRVGLLDYQDLLLGHPAYDLVSLLEDARRDTGEALRRNMMRRYCAASGAAPDTLAREAAALAAQRNLKIVGIFSRLCRRDRKPGYLRLIPRVWDHLQRDLDCGSSPALCAFCGEVPAPTPDVLERLAAGGAPG